MQVMYDPKQVDYKQLVEVFLQNHDPTSLNKQGGDQGTQYRSGIYFHNDEQKQIATQVVADSASQYAVSLFHLLKSSQDCVEKPVPKYVQRTERFCLYLGKSSYGCWVACIHSTLHLEDQLCLRTRNKV